MRRAIVATSSCSIPAPGVFHQLRLTDADNSGILDIAVRGADAVR